MIRGRMGYAAVLGAGLAFFVYFKGWLSWYTLLFLLLLPLLSLALSWPAARGTSLSLRAEPPTVQKGEAVRFLVRFHNRSRLRVPRAECVLTVANVLGQSERPRRRALSVGGRKRQQEALAVTSNYCGRLTCLASKARCCDFLGLFSFSLGTNQVACAYVLPRVVAIQPRLSPEVIGAPGGEGTNPGRPGDDPSETFDLRPYRPGDPLKAVHWKLSGRTEGLLVREFAQRVDCPVELLADLGGSLPGRDVLLDALASVHQFLWENGVGHRVTWLDGETGALTSRDVTGEDDWPPVLRALLSPTGSPGAALALRAGMGEENRRLLCFVGELGTAEQKRLAGLFRAVALVPVHGNGALPAGVAALSPETLAQTLSELTI